MITNNYEHMRGSFLRTLLWLLREFALDLRAALKG